MAWRTLFRNISVSLLTWRSHLSLFRKQSPIIDFVHVILYMQKCHQIKCLHTVHTTSELLWNKSLQSLCKFGYVCLCLVLAVFGVAWKTAYIIFFEGKVTDAILIKFTNRVENQFLCNCKMAKNFILQRCKFFCRRKTCLWPLYL